MKIDKYATLEEMGESKSEKFVDLLGKRYRKETHRFLEQNKSEIGKQLSKSARDYFEKNILKKKNFNEKLMQSYLSKVSEDKYQEFANKLLKATFQDDKELSDEIGQKGEIDELKLTKYFIQSDEKIKDDIALLFDCLGLDLDLSDEVIAKVRDEAMEKELDEKEKEIERLNEEASKSKDNHKKELKKIRDENVIELNKKDKRIAELEEENARLKEQEKHLQELKKKENKDAESPAPETRAVIEKEEEGEKGLSINIENALDDLEARTFLGIVKPEGIKPEKSWVIVTPIVPIVGDNSNIDREKLLSTVDYRSDYSTFILFLDPIVLKMALAPSTADEYPYMSYDQKYSCLYNAFCGKLLFFAPEFRDLGNGERYKLNARLLDTPLPYKDFSNSTFIPAYKGSKKELERKIASKEGLILNNYPYSLSSSLRYVFAKDTIYEVNYIPDEDSDNGEYTHWKSNDQIDKEPKKLALKISDNSSSDYIAVPDCKDNDYYNLYVKNIMFIAAPSSKKQSNLFDEEEFIANMLDNAKAKNLYYEENDLRNFHIAVKSSSLVILAGPSGIGKTRLPTIYANTLGLTRARNTLLFVPISPSYLEPEDVLGYVRPIAEKDNKYSAEYVESQTGLVSFLIDANEHKDKIHLVIFDEMNLSQIEHWFAPFISLLEQDPDSRELKLYSDNLSVKNDDKYPSSILIGENVFFIGTVNIDETTKEISDRLLDRAVVINLSSPSFSSLKMMGIGKGEAKEEVSYSRFNSAVKKVGNSANEFSDREFSFLNELNELLLSSMYNKSISFRSLNKMALYLANSTNILSRKEAFDYSIAQIVIKKISGSKDELYELINEDETKGILSLLHDYSDLSDFLTTRKAVKQKCIEINKYGFSR